MADHSFEAKLPIGGIYALTSACFYAMYLVFLRRKVDSEDKMDIPMFFGKYFSLNSIHFNMAQI